MFIRKAIIGLTGGLFVIWSATAIAVQPLEIRSVNVDFDTNQIFIHGVNFDNGNSLEISLSDLGEIASVDVAPTLIVANFPLAGLPAGNYLLMVSTGGGSVRHDEMAITVGAVGPEGPQGEQGPQGIQGPIGPQGEQGDQGPQGMMGLPGIDGATGPQGLQGEPGVQGPVGATGPQGDTGSQGLTGEPGPQGDQGDTGPVGPQGNQGVQGPIGMQGPVGATGPQGPQGNDGAPGEQGAPGNDGAPGPKGDKGDPGPAGADGMPGLRGEQGPPGPEGPKGETGPEGPPGNAEPPIPPVIGNVFGNVNLGDELAIRQLAFGVQLPFSQAGPRGLGSSPYPVFDPVVITIDKTELSPPLRQNAASGENIGDVTIVYQDLQSFELLTLDLEKGVFVTRITDVPAKRAGDPSLIQLALSFGKIVITGTGGSSSWDWTTAGGETGASYLAQSCSLPTILSFVNVANALDLKERIPILGYSFDMSLNFGGATGQSRDRTQPTDFALAKVFSSVVPETSCLFGDVYATSTKTVRIIDFVSSGLESSNIVLNTARAAQFFFETDSRGEARITTGFDYENVEWTYINEQNVETTGNWDLAFVTPDP